jgi:hypothetical protein
MGYVHDQRNSIQVPEWKLLNRECCAANSTAHTKLLGLNSMFDVMAFMLQLKQATGSHEFAVVPNTVQTCQRTFKQPMVMTLASLPHDCASQQVVGGNDWLQG